MDASLPLPRYEGKRVVGFLADGRHVELISPLTFYDRDGSRWSVPAGAVVDGASIPRVLWSIVGGPFEGLYRDASIIHDWYCSIRSRCWQATHEMFYEASRTSGVPEATAKTMYFAVRWCGPRWKEPAHQAHSLLDLDSAAEERKPGFLSSLTRSLPRVRRLEARTRVGTVPSPGELFSLEDQARVMAAIRASDLESLSLDDLEDMAETVDLGLE